jgi:hypothetical protein
MGPRASFGCYFANMEEGNGRFIDACVRVTVTVIQGRVAAIVGICDSISEMLMQGMIVQRIIKGTKCIHTSGGIGDATRKSNSALDRVCSSRSSKIWKGENSLKSDKIQGRVCGSRTSKIWKGENSLKSDKIQGRVYSSRTNKFGKKHLFAINKDIHVQLSHVQIFRMKIWGEILEMSRDISCFANISRFAIQFSRDKLGNMILKEVWV